MGRQVRVGSEFRWSCDYPAPMLMLIRPRAHDARGVVITYETHWLEPQTPLHEYTDSFGNTCWRFVAPVGPLVVRYDALVTIDGEPDPVRPELALTPVEALPDETLVFTLPSRYIQSDQLMDDAWRLFGDTAPTWARVQAICDWIHTNIEYRPGSTGPSFTAVDAFRQRYGVCRDFAQLGVALCRAVNIPARYTFGFAPDIDVPPPDHAMDFHAWFEAFIGGEWYPFDARFNYPRKGRIPIGRGRDAVDVALSTAYGAAHLDQLTVWADEVTDSAETHLLADRRATPLASPRSESAATRAAGPV